MKNCNLYFEYNGKKILLMKESLQNIDEITTCFVNKEKMVGKLLEGKNLDGSKCSIIIESSNKMPIEFIGSDFRNVVIKFNDEKYINSICSIEPEILLKYFEEKLDDVIRKTVRDLNDFYEKREDYLNNDNIPIVQTINRLKLIISSKNAQTRESKNTNDTLNSKINVKHNIRKYNSNYKNYRDMYCYMVGLSIIEQDNLSYTKDDLQQVYKFLDSASQKIDNLIYEDSQLTFNLELEKPNNINDNDDDDDVVLEYIEKGARV